MRFYGMLALSLAIFGCSSSPDPVYMGGNGTSGGNGGVGSGGGTGDGSGGTGGTGSTGGTMGGQDGGSPGGTMSGFTTVITIVLENHSASSILGSSSAPYINSLANQYALATNYKDSGTHPSLPNYLYMVSGDTQYFGLIDLEPTTSPFPVDKPNLGQQLTTKGIPWRAYQEDMGTPCNLTTSGNYAARHTPFLYFTGIQKDANGLCAQVTRDYKDFAGDLASGQYKFMFVAPNLLDDGHTAATTGADALKQSDDWCKQEIPKILASNAYQQGGVIFLTWDEGDNSIGDQVPMIIISPKLKAQPMKSGTAYSHASYLATMEDLFGVPRLGAAMNATTLSEFFQ